MARGKLVDAAEAEGVDGSSDKALVRGAQTAQPASRLPVPLQFPLVVILSLSISSLGYSFLNEYSKGELASVARSMEGWAEIALLASWRILELALAWFGNWDFLDIASVNVLSHSPTLFLMSTFYNITPATAVTCLAVDVVSSFVPFLLLRPLSRAHSAASTVPNRDIIADRYIQTYTTLLAAAIYSVALFFAYQTYLPRSLVLYFDGIPTIEPAHSATTVLVSPSAAALALLSGLAARSFIFTPFEATGHTVQDDEVARFDPVSATLGQTLQWNLWGYTARTKVVIVRTAIVTAITGINTFLQCARTINGVESTGAALYASVWMGAALLTGIGLGVVGRD